MSLTAFCVGWLIGAVGTHLWFGTYPWGHSSFFLDIAAASYVIVKIVRHYTEFLND